MILGWIFFFLTDLAGGGFVWVGGVYDQDVGFWDLVILKIYRLFKDSMEIVMLKRGIIFSTMV